VKSFDPFVEKKTWDRLMMSDLPPGRRVLCFVVWIERQKRKYDRSAHRLFLTPQAAKLKLGFFYSIVFPQSLARFMTSNETCS
jgi:hypothetical protein